MDTTAREGVEYEYFVRSLTAAIRGNDPVYLDPDRLDDFRAWVAPSRGKQFATMGMTAPPENWAAPKVLFQTEPSRRVKIVAGK